MVRALRIGDLARRTGTKVNTIRFYEEVGLLPKAARTASGRRTYGDDDLQRLAFIRHSRALGFSTEMIRSLLKLSSDPGQPCDEARDIAKRHLSEVSARIERLKSLEAELDRMVSNCSRGRRVADCRVLESLCTVPGTTGTSTA
jgi:DNA-binding transcriptional MerR regulator